MTKEVLFLELIDSILGDEVGRFNDADIFSASLGPDLSPTSMVSFHFGSGLSLQKYSIHFCSHLTSRLKF